MVSEASVATHQSRLVYATRGTNEKISMTFRLKMAENRSVILYQLYEKSRITEPSSIREGSTGGGTYRICTMYIAVNLT